MPEWINWLVLFSVPMWIGAYNAKTLSSSLIVVAWYALQYPDLGKAYWGLFIYIVSVLIASLRR